MKILDRDGRLIIECAGAPDEPSKSNLADLYPLLRELREIIGVTEKSVKGNRRAGDQFASVNVGKASMGGGQKVR